MKRLGISVYPEHAGKKACYDYMTLAGKYGFNKGDVSIVNDNLEHYRGELMIVTETIPVVENYNYVGHINKDEQLVLDCIKPRHSFKIEIR